MCCRWTHLHNNNNYYDIKIGYKVIRYSENYIWQFSPNINGTGDMDVKNKKKNTIIIVTMYKYRILKILI